MAANEEDIARTLNPTNANHVLALMDPMVVLARS
jgi:hypothetical protein